MTAALVQVAIGLVLVVVGGFFGYVFKTLQYRESELYVQKRGVYLELLRLFRDVFLKKLKPDSQKLKERMLDVSLQLAVHASNDVLLKFVRWKENAAGRDLEDLSGVVPTFKEFIDIFLEIRKDLGHTNTGVGYATVLKLIITPQEADHIESLLTENGSIEPQG